MLFYRFEGKFICDVLLQKLNVPNQIAMLDVYLLFMTFCIDR